MGAQHPTEIRSGGGPDFNFRVATDGSDLIVEFHGEIDTAVRDEAVAIVTSAAEDRTKTVVLDLSAVTFIDSAGLHALVRLDAWAIESNRKLVIRNPTDVVQRLLALSGLDTKLSVEMGDQPA